MIGRALIYTMLLLPDKQTFQVLLLGCHNNHNWPRSRFLNSTPLSQFLTSCLKRFTAKYSHRRTTNDDRKWSTKLWQSAHSTLCWRLLRPKEKLPRPIQNVPISKPYTIYINLSQTQRKENGIFRCCKNRLHVT